MTDCVALAPGVMSPISVIVTPAWRSFCMSASTARRSGDGELRTVYDTNFSVQGGHRVDGFGWAAIYRDLQSWLLRRNQVDPGVFMLGWVLVGGSDVRL
jgi:hypothetical protein